MVKIRLRRQGGGRHAFYRLVVADAAAPRNGRFLAEIGYYNPTTDPPVLHVEKEQALRWLRHGAQPSDTARALLSRAGVMAALRAPAGGTGAGEGPAP